MIMEGYGECEVGGGRGGETDGAEGRSGRYTFIADGIGGQ